MLDRKHTKTPKNFKKPIKKEEMTAAGLVNFGTYCKDPCFVKLSQTIVSYTRTLIPHCNAVLKMYSEELYYPIIDSISELLRIIINVLTDAMRNVRDDDKSKFWCEKSTFFGE